MPSLTMGTLNMRGSEGEAALIVPPGQRKELERSVLDRNDVDSALAEIESLLKYA